MKKGILMVILVIIGIRIYINRPVKQELITPGKTIEEKVEVTKIAIMADIHNDTEELKKALAKENNLVIVAGDLTINGTKKELEAIKTTLDGTNYLVVPGNHDLYKNQFESVFGLSYQSLKVNNLKLILINNGDWKGLGAEQKKWIEAEVGECKIITCIGIMHMPLENSLTDHVMGEDNEVVTKEAAWLHKLLVDNNVKDIYAGHLHYSSSYVTENLKTNLVGAISSTRNNQTPRFLEIEWDGKNLVNRIVEIE